MSATYARTVCGERPATLVRWWANRSTACRNGSGRPARVASVPEGLTLVCTDSDDEVRGGAGSGGMG